MGPMTETDARATETNATVGGTVGPPAIYSFYDREAETDDLAELLDSLESAAGTSPLTTTARRVLRFKPRRRLGGRSRTPARLKPVGRPPALCDSLHGEASVKGRR